jgi:hypothetical protein
MTIGGGGTPSVCPSTFCTTAYSENCGPTCEPITTPQCLACEVTYECVDDNKCSALTTNAQAGPAQNVPRAALCNEALSCLRTTGCSILPDPFTDQDVVASCYCGPGGFANCTGNGPCHTAFERAYETSDKTVILSRLTDTIWAGARAYNRLDCDHYSCPDAGCFKKNP